ncbi:MAG TPA: hypothetical protein VK281_14715 [Xanthobacteraceae bacterium]|nr:hypothetical protein [Xanthobacteraceae bacterium]
MDLVTLVTVCALGVEPKLMHALVWHQSGGDPWSFSLPGDPDRRTYSTMQDVIREVGALGADGGTVRVGLAGLPVDASSATPAMFMPCVNITKTAQLIAQLAERCKTLPRSGTESTFCAVAAYRGSWEQPDIIFADAVAASVVKGDAPNFDMPNDSGTDDTDVASDAPPAGSRAAPAASAVTSEDRERGWSSALFPAKPQQTDSARGTRRDNPHADRARSSDAANALSVTTKPPTNSLFVPRSSDRTQ